MTYQKIEAIITAITGVRVIITKETLLHITAEHFSVVPKIILLELIELILKDPSELYHESQNKNREFNFFYRLENCGYIVAVVKVIPEGAFLSTVYPTGRKPRNKHKNLKRIKL